MNIPARAARRIAFAATCLLLLLPLAATAAPTPTNDVVSNVITLELTGITTGDINGIPGVTDAMEVTSLSIAVNRATTGSGTGGAGAGKATPGDLVITKHIDKASPQLFVYLVSGKVFDQARIIVWQRTATGEGVARYTKQYSYTLKSVVLTAIANNLAESRSPLPQPDETLSLMYLGLRVDDFQDPNNPTTFQWDLANQTAP